MFKAKYSKLNSDNTGFEDAYCIATDDSVIKKGRGFYNCPWCPADVFLKKGEHNTVVSHFAHYPGMSCSAHWWESESNEHRAMKSYIYEYFKNMEYVESIEYESKVDIEGSYLIADIMITTKDGKKISIECQASSKTYGSILTKTTQYSNAGIYVLWIFSRKQSKKFYRKGIKMYIPIGIKIADGKISERVYACNGHFLYAIETLKSANKDHVFRTQNLCEWNLDFTFIKFREHNKILTVTDSYENEYMKKPSKKIVEKPMIELIEEEMNKPVEKPIKNIAVKHVEKPVKKQIKKPVENRIEKPLKKKEYQDFDEMCAELHEAHRILVEYFEEHGGRCLIPPGLLYPNRTLDGELIV